MSLLRRANRRHFYRHPLQLLLAILGIALGVAMLVSVDLAIESAQRGFSLSMEALTGKTTHHLVAATGTLDENLYPRLRREFGGIALSPIVEGYGEADGQTLRLSGIDPFAAGGSQTRYAESASAAAYELLTQPDTALISRITAARLKLAPGAAVEIELPSGRRAIKIAGYLDPEDAPDAALEGLLLMDIATAQEALNRLGRLDRIDLILPSEEQAKAVAAALPEGTELIETATRQSATARMTRAFEINLRAMSLLALLVGTFLIYNTMSFAVLQRRTLLADLRVLGVTRGELMAEILVEAAALGLIGGLAGLLLGALGAEVLVKRVTQTINDVYYVLTVTQFHLSPAGLARGLLLGLGASLLAALPAALEAASTRPAMALRRSGLEGDWRRWAPYLCVAGVAVSGLGAAVLGRETASLVPALAGVFLLMMGYALAVPLALLILSKWAGWVPSTPVRLGVRGTSAALSRTGSATAALAVACAAAVGVGLMVESFRTAVDDWLGQLLQADLYLARPAEPNTASPPFPPGLIDAAAHLPGVASVSLARRNFVESSAGRIEILAYEMPDRSRPAFRLKAPVDHSIEAWARFADGQAVMISEPFASRHHLAVGDRMGFVTARGRMELPVGGIFFDYRSDQGLALFPLLRYQEWWDDAGITSIGLYLQPGAALETTRAALDQALQGAGAAVVRSNREIRENSMEVFQRTFAITQVLRLLAIIVALVGILGALLALQLERGREFAILRALGLTPGQLGSLVMVQTGFLGLCAGLLALPLGLILAWALVSVINLRSFGWTMDLVTPAASLWEAPVLAVAAALLAGVYPAWRAGKLAPARVLREE